MFGSTPQKKFLKAAESGDVVELNRCLTQEVPASYGIDVRDSYGRTALIRAARAGAVDTLKMLIGKKADLEVADSSGRTALWWACSNGRTQAAKLLIAAGASVQTHDNDYAYALHLAAQGGDLDIVKALAGGGADLNVVTKTYFQTPLHVAIQYRRNPAVEFLLAQGARIDIKDSNSRTPGEYAKAIGANALRDMIENAPRKAAPAAAAAAPVSPAIPPTPAPKATDAPGESWMLLAPDTVAQVNVYPPIGRKLTRIFNFGERERTVISENLKTGTEAPPNTEKFDALAEDVVAQAAEKLKGLGGGVPDKAAKKAFNL